MYHAEAVCGLIQRGKVVTSIDIPDYCEFRDINVLAADLFHALSTGLSM